MLAQHEVWSELREAEQELRSVIAEGTPSGRHLWRKFRTLHRRLELEQFRPAVEKALVVAEQHDW